MFYKAYFKGCGALGLLMIHIKIASWNQCGHYSGKNVEIICKRWKLVLNGRYVPSLSFKYFFFKPGSDTCNSSWASLDFLLDFYLACFLMPQMRMIHVLLWAISYAIAQSPLQNFLSCLVLISSIFSFRPFKIFS